MNKYFLYLFPNENNKIKYFYLVDIKNDIFYGGNQKISGHSNKLNNLKTFLDQKNFLIIPINYEKFNIFSDMKYSDLKNINYKNFLKTYNLHEWII